MDLNEILGRVIKVNLARPMKGPVQLGGNRAGRSFGLHPFLSLERHPSSMGIGGVATTKSKTSSSQWRSVSSSPCYDMFIICVQATKLEQSNKTPRKTVHHRTKLWKNNCITSQAN
jgi:hypothetical protein